MTGPTPGPARPPGDPARAVVDWRAAVATIVLIRHRWVPAVLTTLDRRTLRYGQLRARVGHGVSHKMLTDTLREMERRGLVDHSYETAEQPPSSLYRLTPLGGSLFVPLRALEAWYFQHRDQLPPGEAGRLPPS